MIKESLQTIIEPHERITEDAQARLLEETVQTSYHCGNEKFYSV